MHKRQFLHTGWIGAAALGVASAHAQHVPKGASGPVVLTVTGAIGAGNRGALDPALDQMMAKQKLQFPKAHVFDFAALTAMPAQSIRPTLEYDAKPHALKGPSLLDVVRATGAKLGPKATLSVRAVDGYAIQLPVADAQKYGYIVATHLDDRPLALGGLGPLYVVYDADRHPDMMALALPARFSSCPWGAYQIEVREG